MSQKNIVQEPSMVNRQANGNKRELLFVTGVILIVALVIWLATLQAKSSDRASASNVTTVLYSNALAMQYAQPWLDKQAAAAAPVVQFSDALAMQYAQPWLDKQSVEAVPSAAYSEALALFYAQPWLEAQQTKSCNGRLDAMYACQYGNWQSQK